MKAQLHSYYIEHLKALRNTSKEVGRSLDPGAMHNMRLSIKRMRVFFGFLARHEERTIRSAPFLEEAARIFRPSGRLRDLQIQQENMRAIELRSGIPYPEYQAFLQNAMHIHQTRLIQRLGKSNLLKLAPRPLIVEAALSKRTVKETSRLFRDQMDLLFMTFVQYCQRWESEQDPELLHKARRNLKNVMYLMNIAKVSKARIQQRMHTALHMKNTEQDIGKWHDKEVGLARLKTFLKNNPLPEDRTLIYADLHKRLEKERDKALKKAYRAAYRILSEEKRSPLPHSSAL